MAICSIHFVSGGHSNDPLTPDYVPSLFETSKACTTNPHFVIEKSIEMLMAAGSMVMKYMLLSFDIVKCKQKCTYMCMSICFTQTRHTGAVHIRPHQPNLLFLVLHIIFIACGRAGD